LILGVGCDLVKISRIAKAIGNPRFRERVYTQKERERLEASPDPDTFAAGRWAAKEAVSKALGCGFSQCPPDCVEVLPDDSGRPLVTLTGAALARMEALGGKDLQISLSHEDGYAMAFAVLEGER